MKTNKQNADFLHIGKKLTKWYDTNARQLPWRQNQLPYNIWISEIVLQQTQVKQGLGHYLRFIERFPTVKELHQASEDDVLLYWKGLGYYSRAINVHKAAHQIVEDFGGEFPNHYNDILKLKGVGKYTAAAIASICFDEKIPAVDGNFYRVLSRIFADDFDISSSKAFQHFSDLALLVMPDEKPGEFNQAIMDIGAEICRPKNPLCMFCPVNEDCMAFQTGRVSEFPVKTIKVKVSDLSLKYFFVKYQNQFLIKQRGNDFIWKKLYEFPTSIPENWNEYIINSKIVNHKLTHKNLSIEINLINIDSKKEFEKFASDNDFLIVNETQADEKSFPKPLQDFYESVCLS
ncbi:A/G-specific adenine glycosylase [Epilithonimonas pallida]|uniref:A/G-specific DNA-adenine glycosylase n=1 Tax=Epilithonimonas pallida TaxID=373671 RepID=A0ABY1R0V6_9FLAO|nr:A/G-specific adenine glycosylase [Epilithonimonas pallida]SMP91768.1 A/G-specific DNA-adenine glycosylase [Epilithonimonas pallida]